jgi:hypothetical protein
MPYLLPHTTVTRRRKGIIENLADTIIEWDSFDCGKIFQEKK